MNPKYRNKAKSYVPLKLKTVDSDGAIRTKLGRKPKASPVKSVSLDIGNLHTTPVETLAVSGTQADIRAFMASGRAIEVRP